MRLANRQGRAVLVIGDTIADLAQVSDGRFGSDPMDAYENWEAVTEFAASVTVGTDPLVETELGPPVPAPRQVFAIGLNYRSHAAETGRPVPEVPATFTKFPTALSGAFDDIELRVPTADWEVELVVVIGRRAETVPAADAWDHVAGLTIGQDISDRVLQNAAGAQFSLGKSRRGYAPTGPWVVSVDEFADPDDLELGCSIDGETVQQARTSDLVFGVPALIETLSDIVTLLPGDLVFTGTPAGVGVARQPPRYLQPGQLLETWIEGIGTMRNRCR